MSAILKEDVETTIWARGKSIVIDPVQNSGRIVIAVHAAKDKAKTRKIDVALLVNHLVVDKRGVSTLLTSTGYWDGEIPAALAGILLGMKAPGAQVIASVTFIAILMTILIQAPTTRWLGGKLRLLEKN